MNEVGILTPERIWAHGTSLKLGPRDGDSTGVPTSSDWRTVKPVPTRFTLLSELAALGYIVG